MHPNELEIEEGLVRRLLARQFPQWADLPLERVQSAGTDNAIYRLGPDMSVRLPRIDWAVGQVDREMVWLPHLAPHLPLAVPIPIAKGLPADGYPWEWGISPWLEGEIATAERLSDLNRAAEDMAAFVAALHRIDPAGGPPASRGGPLTERDEPVREAIGALAGKVDTDAVTSAWEAALAAPAWSEAPVWIHGDAYDGNLLARDGRLSAVIDWSGVGVGDPAADLIVAWSLFSRESREVFRTQVAADDATWARAKGWALSVSLIALPYYMDTNPIMVANSRHRLREVLPDQ
jgi:aminoglycoside phosphotransferase (APT) family kinase protein